VFLVVGFGVVERVHGILALVRVSIFEGNRYIVASPGVIEDEHWLRIFLHNAVLQLALAVI
jgi:hypothetical protein